ncbi:probable tRNA (uracil-O(2)-)-methyltransferase [Latimeria chalumnae]|uniref:tRNA (uracil-O(2)-)-methyltransferase n=1 Tax=Latimeria chalumnae TaxID=7897 RepID=H3AEB2_LATCH|nr:PREDICTED: probable tRNA (uracil-O(2)-)-methyltransferase [Latimeria chalumnae]|eukprot:XP_006004847.1 PREDICTED: probable tRNA (uracil-O(2)-)-methyltransferase [Latimeria chalumnae]
METTPKRSFLREVLLESSSSVFPDGFWSAVAVWVEKPQVANRRLYGSGTEKEWELQSCRELREALREFLGVDPGAESLGWEIFHFVSGSKEDGTDEREAAGFHLTLRTLFPKANPHKISQGRELIIKDVTNANVTFIPLEENAEGGSRIKKSNSYQIGLNQLENDQWSISLSTLCSELWDSDGIICPKTSWLENELLSKLAKWSIENKKSEFKSTLSLISVENYSQLYQKLKEKYKELVKVWPEVTDPEKFVYEDVAIATYLLVLWEEERIQKGHTKKQSFVDLGCGNGLLVHILSNEGHPGRGIDIRKRKIWDMYGPQTHLEECAITPSDSFLFPGVDWIIGNHSDELTPWLPVIAARSSYFCRCFVLPCCFFDFYGKYSRRQSRKTQYREYLDFVTEVGAVCGFNVEEDCLRIPSTKRVCLIGKTRTYNPLKEVHVDEQRTNYINGRRGCIQHAKSTMGSCNEMTDELSDKCAHYEFKDHASDEVVRERSAECDLKAPACSSWIAGFQPREKIEQVRNCAALPQDLIHKVVLQVANALLNVDTVEQSNSVNEEKTNRCTWNRGGSLSLREVAEILEKDLLQKLKRECGGLQTLLKNNHQVFEVCNGRVHIRDWRTEKQTRNNKPSAKRKLHSEVCKTRLCWFYVNHPEGCPRTSECCPFAHGMEELRPYPIKNKKIPA